MPQAKLYRNNFKRFVLAPTHWQRIKGYDYWEKRKPGRGATSIMTDDGFLFLSDTGAITDFFIFLSDTGGNTDHFLFLGP